MTDSEPRTVGVENFVAAMLAAEIAPVPIHVRAGYRRTWWGKKYFDHRRVIGPDSGWIYAVVTAVVTDPEDAHFLIATTDARLVAVIPGALHATVERLGHRIEIGERFLLATDPDAAFRVERVKVFGALPTKLHPHDPTLREIADGLRAGFRTLEGYREFLDGAPAEWVRAWELGATG